MDSTTLCTVSAHFGLVVNGRVSLLLVSVSQRMLFSIGDEFQGQLIINLVAWHLMLAVLGFPLRKTIATYYY